MKKLLFTLSIALAGTLATFAQEISKWDTSRCGECSENVFVFDKLTIAKFEKDIKYDTYMSFNAEQKLNVVKACIVVNMNDSICKSVKKLSEISPTDKFIMVGNCQETHETIIKNLKTKEFYIIEDNAFNYLDYSRHAAQMIKIVPKVPSAEEVELLSRYKSLIKSAKINCVALQAIQRKYLTRGYFDANRVKGIDKQNYNKNLASLKVKADKLAEIDRYEDKDNKAEYKLTTSEIASLSDINNWNMNFYPIN